ncbi:MAG TPA: hypothetical protein VGH71_03465 [Gammaproteobacteria bacterium]|jgi:membrane protease YdiL (CAAX protease family)
MHSLNPRTLLPALALAAAALLATWVAVHAGDSPWTVLLAPLLLALAVLAADFWQARQQGLPLRPSPGVLMLAASLVVAGLIVGVGNPRQEQEMMPVLAAVSAVAISTRQGTRRYCFGLKSR